MGMEKVKGKTMLYLAVNNLKTYARALIITFIFSVQG